MPSSYNLALWQNFMNAWPLNVAKVVFSEDTYREQVTVFLESIHLSSHYLMD